jgi:very-short-patch-repair endonuclease
MNDMYNPNLARNARLLRKSMTDEERHLWYDFLKDLPITFRRQKVIGNYIVDFYCASAKLVIELDGSQHYEKDGLDNDIRRDAYLRSCGLTVKRYSNKDINQRFEDVCRDIYNYVFCE